MAKYTNATAWEPIGEIAEGDDGAMGNLEYTCPHCHFDTGNLIFIGERNVGLLGRSWETDQECPVCNKQVTVRVKV